MGAVGCGGGAPGRPRPPAGAPRPAETVQDAVGRIERAASAESCGPVRALLHSMYGAVGERACRSVQAELVGFHDARVGTYGTGVAIDFHNAEGQRKLAALALDADRLFKLDFLEDERAPAVGATRPPPEFDLAVRAAVRAMQIGDCDTFLANVSRQIGLGVGPDRQVCRRVSDLPFRRELVADQAARPHPLGGNGAVAFYSVRTRPAHYFTLVMRREAAPPGSLRGPRYVLVNAAPAR